MYSRRQFFWVFPGLCGPDRSHDDGWVVYVRVGLLSGTADDTCLSNLTVWMYSSMLGRLAEALSMIQADSVCS